MTEIIKDEINKMIKSQNVVLKEFAKKIGYPYTYVSDVLATSRENEKGLSVRFLNETCKYFKIDIYTLYINALRNSGKLK